MSTNPLFPSADHPDDTRNPAGYVLPKQTRTIQPAESSELQNANQAADLIREKLARIYAEEPDALAEEQEVKAASKPRSKHQQFMQELSTSGKSLAEIQTAWHTYYVSLSDTEKHEVWQEFYAANNQPNTSSKAAPVKDHLSAVPARTFSRTVKHPRSYPTQPHKAPMEPAVVVSQSQSLPALPDKRSIKSIRETIQKNVSAQGKLTVRHHVQSLLFGLGVGMIALIILLFGFFNEVVIAPFIQPSRNVGATPIIVDPSSITASTAPEIIIPKIHLEIPVDYSQTSTNEAIIENALENGIVHYPSTVAPGQQGNSAFFGHSSNNIFNPGKYKFAFVLLHELVPGDTFYLTYGGKVYIYKVFSKQIVSPSDVSVLNNIAGHTATATLITCDPPGTSLNRLVVVGDQISPDPSTNTDGTNTVAAPVTSAQLPGNGPTLFSRLWHDIF